MHGGTTIITDYHILALVTLSLLDTFITYSWAKTCAEKFPEAPLNKVESNPFIVVCWNNYGLFGGSIISGIVLLAVQYLLASIHNATYWVIIIILAFAVFNHSNNFIKLRKMDKRD